MPAVIPDAARALLEAPNFVHLAIGRPDGSIQAIVVWADLDGDEIIVNSAEGRAWPANLRRAGRATISVHNAENGYEFLAIECTLSGDTHEGADDTIDALAHKYMGVDSYPFRVEGEQRVTFRLTPERVTHRGT